MSITLTLEDFKARFPSISAPDVVIEDFIDVVAQIQPCLESNYPDAVARMIAYNLAAHFCEESSGKRVKSQTAPSGASQSYDLGTGKDGLAATSFGRIALQMDTAGCTGAFTSSGVVILCVGGRNSP